MTGLQKPSARIVLGQTSRQDPISPRGPVRLTESTGDLTRAQNHNSAKTISTGVIIGKGVVQNGHGIGARYARYVVSKMYYFGLRVLKLHGERSILKHRLELGNRDRFRGRRSISVFGGRVRRCRKASSS